MNLNRSNRDVEYLVSAPHPLQGRRITEVSDNYVEWDLERREELQRFQLSHPHVNRCPRELYAVEGEEEGRMSNYSGRFYKKRKLSDGMSENSEDDQEERLVEYPYEAREYKQRQSCSWREKLN